MVFQTRFRKLCGVVLRATNLEFSKLKISLEDVRGSAVGVLLKPIT